MVLQVTAEVEPGEAYKKSLLKAMEPCKYLEQVEVVSNTDELNALFSGYRC